ncbi:MAG: methyltransferase [Planctomycetes bacterium]|nr:methyltransferase [Planctomycetota bacterium]
MSPVERFLDHVTASCSGDSFVELRLTSPIVEGPVEKLVVRLIGLAKGLHLAVTEREARRDTVRNLPLEAGLAWLRDQLGSTWRAAFLSTTTGDWQLSHDRKGAFRLVTHPARTRTAPSRAHDRDSRRVLDERAHDWLAALGVVDDRGRTRAGMASKQQQIARYVELLTHLAHDCGWDAGGETDAPPLTVVDVGCGKGHLTFGAWHLLHRVLRRTTRVIGVELRAELVDHANRIARDIDSRGVEFVVGDAASLAMPRVDAWIALHACDTAPRCDGGADRGVGHRRPARTRAGVGRLPHEADRVRRLRAHAEEPVDRRRAFARAVRRPRAAPRDRRAAL